jgi:ABC-type multidrug transport system ATPase subunit
MDDSVANPNTENDKKKSRKWTSPASKSMKKRLVQKSGASYGVQARALFRRNAALQKRSPCANLFIVLTPICLVILLFVLQKLIDSALDTPDTKCGCLCLSCCKTVDGVETCWNSTERPCTSNLYDTCTEYDEDMCGFDYSNARQAYFCPVDNPSIWPPVAQVPSVGYLAHPESPDAAMLITGDDSSIVDEIVLFPVPNVTAQDATRALEFSQRGSRLNATYVSTSLLGASLGTFQKFPNLNYYLEPAFYPTSDYNGTLSLLTNDASDPQTIALVNALTASLDASERPNMPPLSVVSQQVTQVYVENDTEINQKLYCGYGQARCYNGSSEINEYTNAWDFSGTDFDAGRYQMRFWYNATGRYPQQGNAPTQIVRVQAAINAATNAFLRRAVGSDSIARFVGLMTMPKPGSKLTLDIASLVGVLFYTWLLQLLMPMMLATLVSEKENRLRNMMKMHGLGDSVYWSVQYVWYFAMNLIYIWILIGIGSAIDLAFFTKTSYSFQFVFYLLWTCCLVATTFLLSACYASSRTATVSAFLYVFATGLIGYLLLTKLVSAGYWWVVFIELIPGFALYRGLYEIANYAFKAAYASGSGITWSNLSDDDNGLVAVMIIFAVESVVFLVLAWYVEQIYPQGCGVARHPLFFLGKKYKSEINHTRAGEGSDEVKLEMTPEDIVKEQQRVESILDPTVTSEESQSNDYSIIVSKLRKVFPGKKKKIAVKDLTLAIRKGECFGLLGPNGAGKSTSLNMLTGFLTPNSGSAIIEGFDITSDMEMIYRIMGVCPQDNLLWESLTAREHLLFYARLKQLKGEQLEKAVEAALKSVNLLNGGVADKQVKTYSGGMKRRLSVAISFVGNPSVVYLDEPSTGLDPASRQNLWNVVKAGKSGRGIILTTHSMEEASVLCDRLGIFVDGELVCIGAPKELTSRYGGFFVFTITVKSENHGMIAPFVKEMCRTARLTYSVAGTEKYELPSTDITLDKVFDTMEHSTKAKDIGIIDWGISNATLEEVFIKFAKEFISKQ